MLLHGDDPGTMERARVLNYEIDLFDSGIVPSSRQETVAVEGMPSGSDDPIITSSMAWGHVLQYNDSVIWCSKCGGITTGKRLSLLRKRCDGTPSSGYSATRLQKMESGFHPYCFATPLDGVTRPVRVSDLAKVSGRRPGDLTQFFNSDALGGIHSTGVPLPNEVRAALSGELDFG